jgi:hypothetical protein
MRSLEPLTPRYRNGTRRWRCVIQIESMFSLRSTMFLQALMPVSSSRCHGRNSGQEEGLSPTTSTTTPPRRVPRVPHLPSSFRTLVVSAAPDAGHSTIQQGETEWMDALPMRKQGESTHTSRSHACALVTPSRIDTTRGVWHVFATPYRQSRTPVLRR